MNAPFIQNKKSSLSQFSWLALGVMHCTRYQQERRISLPPPAFRLLAISTLPPELTAYRTARMKNTYHGTLWHKFPAPMFAENEESIHTQRKRLLWEGLDETCPWTHRSVSAHSTSSRENQRNSIRGCVWVYIAWYTVTTNRQLRHRGRLPHSSLEIFFS